MSFVVDTCVIIHNMMINERESLDEVIGSPSIFNGGSCDSEASAWESVGQLRPWGE